MSTVPNSAYDYQVGGSLPVDAPTYVVRQADEDFYQGLKAGKFCYVLNSRQMGKSSLRVRTMQRLQAEGIACAGIDITAIGTWDITPEQWYAGVVDSIVSSLNLYDSFDLVDWWTKHKSLYFVNRFSKFIEEILLPLIPQSIVIFVDEIDSVLSLKFNIDDFFAVIRDCYNKRAAKPDYRRLTFALIGVATPSDLIQDKRRTPFNIGRAIELTGFQVEEAQPLALGLAQKVSNPEDVLREVLAWTGGQPFLTQKLCQLVVQQATVAPPQPPLKRREKSHNPDWVEELVQKRVVENWEAQDEPEHLRTIRDRILFDEKRAGRLLGLYQQVLTSPVEEGEGEISSIQNPKSKIQDSQGLPADDTPEQMELRLTGLVVRQQGRLSVANRIYQEVFNQSWVEKELAKLRPYSESFNAWLASNYQDESRLLRGQALQDALGWAAGKSLSDQDYQFLTASQELDKREMQRILAAEKEASRILAQANQALEAVLKSASSKALFLAGQEFDALLEALRAGKQLQSLDNSVKEKANAQIQVLTALQQAVYGVRERNRLEGHSDWVNCVCFSPDGKMIASASSDFAVKLWTQEGRELQTLTGHRGYVTCVSFSPDGQMIASASADNTIKLWNREGRELQILKGHSDWVNCVCFSPDGKMIASASRDRTIKLWSLEGRELQTLSGHNGYVTCVSFSPDGQIIASSSSDSTIKLSNREGKELQTLRWPWDWIKSVSFSPDGQIIASSSGDGTIKLWTQEGRELQTLTGHRDQVISVSFSPDGQMIASASADKTVKLWSREGRELKILKGHSGRVNSVNYSPDSQIIASASRDNTIKLWSLEGRELLVLQGHQGAIFSISFSPDGQTIASASSDKTIKLWNREGGQPQTLQAHSAEVMSISFSPNGQMIASASSDGIIKLWSLDGRELRTLKGHNDTICNVSFSPDGQTLTSASWDNTIKFWSLEGKELQTLTELQSAIYGVSFSPNGQMVAAASTSWDGIIKLWSIDGRELQTFKGHSDVVSCVSFSPNGQLLASASADKTIRFWSLDGRELRILQGHSAEIYSVSFSFDGQTLASASADGIIKLWNLSGRELQTLQGHSTEVYGLSFSPDGQTLASASADGTIILWNFNLDSLMKLGCSWVGDYLRNNPNVSESDRCLCDRTPYTDNSDRIDP